MTSTVRSIRNRARRLDVQCERFHPEYRGDTYVSKFVYDERNTSGSMTMRALVKCSLTPLESE